MQPSPSPLANPLATITQLTNSSSQLDGIPPDLETSIRFAGARLTQAAGILLKLPQEVIAQAVIVFTRFWVGEEGGSLAVDSASQVSASALYLICKLSPWPKTARSIVNVYAYLSSLPTDFPSSAQILQHKNDADAHQYYIPDSLYQARKRALFATEQRILAVLGFSLRVALPYTLCITYLQALDVFSPSLSSSLSSTHADTHARASQLAKRALAYLNTALLSPQMLYLTHAPPALAVAAIYLAAREVGVRLPDCEWWEVFDVEREELGFCVVGMLSVEGFAREEERKWGEARCPVSVAGVEAEIRAREGAEGE